MKEGDLILVSAEATGLGEPMEAVIDKIETFMGQTLVTVTYTQPDALSGFGGCFVDTLLIKFTIPVIHLAAVSMVSVNGISTLSMA